MSHVHSGAPYVYANIYARLMHRAILSA